MKKLFLLFVLSLFAVAIYAQTPNWLWAETQVGGTCYTQSEQIKADTAGNIFMSGRFAGTMTLGGQTVSAGATTVFSGKFDSAGNFFWVTPHPYTNNIDYNYGFTVDNSGNSYCTGNLGSGCCGTYIDKCSSNGFLIRSVRPSGNASGYSLVTDAAGEVYGTGDYAGALVFTTATGTITLNSIGGSNDIWIAKFDSVGYCVWAQSAGGSGVDGGRGIALDPEDNVYVCGSYNGTANFGTYTAPTATGVFPNFFIAKYDSSGNFIRVSTATNAGFDNSFQFWRWEELSVDSCGNAYAAGFFTDTARFGNLFVTSNGGHDVFVAKCHFDGNWEWVKSAGGPGEDDALGIALDRAGDVYAVGSFQNTALFGTVSVTASNANGSPFIAKYANSTGDLKWVQVGGGTGNWGFQAISIDKKGYIYLCGDGGNGTGIFGTATVSDQSSCGQNVLLAKLDTIAPRKIIPVLSKSYCPGSTDTIPYSLIGSFNSGNTFTVELSDSTGNFISYVILGSVTSDTNGKIGITIPDTTKPGSTYLIRIVSSNPATSSYAACTGDYIDNVYVNSFYITIGGGLNVALSASDSNICSGGSVQLMASGGTSYLWSNGDTTGTITVNPIEDTTFSILINNGGCKLDTFIKVTVTPAPPLTVLPPDTLFCNGQSATLYVSNGGSDFIWIPATGLIDSTATGDSVVSSPTATTTYTVMGTNSGGCSATGSTIVTVIPSPNKPTFTQVGDTLISSSQYDNQWYRNDTLLKNDTSQNLSITIPGEYWVVVNNEANGCSTSSDSMQIKTGINQLSVIGNQLSIYPNPFNNDIFIKINSSAVDIKDWNLQITDELGRTVFSRLSLDYSNNIDLSDLPCGIYFITVINKTGRAAVPVVKQN